MRTMSLPKTGALRARLDARPQTAAAARLRVKAAIAGCGVAVDPDTSALISSELVAKVVRRKGAMP